MKTSRDTTILIFTIFWIFVGCKEEKKHTNIEMKEKQLTFNPKTHALDNNDNFSPDGKYLCYDTRHMVYNTNLANSKTIEKIEIATGEETVLWEPKNVSGEYAAPGVAAVSYHPTENKVIFIHGPQLEEVAERGYYDIRNRTGAIVDGDAKKGLVPVELRDVHTAGPTIPGAHRGGTHRHEFSRNGERIGFTYDDFLQRDYDRTIGYMEADPKAPQGYGYYFAVLLKPAKTGTSKSGEIEKAYGDSWVDSSGTKRAFIGKVRAQNGVDYENSLFVAEIPNDVDITTAFSGDAHAYPEPPLGINIRRLTHSVTDEGIVRGSYNGKRIAYLSNDEKGVKQVFAIPVDGSDRDHDQEKRPKQVTHFDSDASFLRWHTSDDWLFSISDGKIHASFVGDRDNFGKTLLLTPENMSREALVVSPDGKMLAYNVSIADPVTSRILEGKEDNSYSQIFVMDLNDALKLTNAR